MKVQEASVLTRRVLFYLIVTAFIMCMYARGDDDREISVREYVFSWNKLAQFQKSTAHFDWRKDSEEYILQLWGICYCIICVAEHETLFTDLSSCWYGVSGSRRVEGIDEEGIIKAFVDSTGKYRITSKSVL